MNKIYSETQTVRDILSHVIGETRAKTYFSYYGIFKDDLMFGLYKDGKFYLKVALEDVSKIAKHHDVIPLVDPAIVQSRRYYYLPDHILSNIKQYHHWFDNSVKEVKENKQTSYYNKKHQIRFLPNMSFSFERMLRKINIRTIEQLVDKGEIATFIELVKIGIEANEVILLKLHGAINRQLVYTISQKVRIALLREADEALYAAGLRRVFQSKLAKIDQ
ncbi:MAG: TfoX/Sxy family protein [Pasteurellaceae bacterium]|nr:TfoX/Sxy family protein [Pasteurellaceae bacterium]